MHSKSPGLNFHYLPSVYKLTARAIYNDLNYRASMQRVSTDSHLEQLTKCPTQLTLALLTYGPRLKLSQ